MDKELSADEQKKENDKIDKEVAKAKERRAKADEKGTETDPRGHEVVTVRGCWSWGVLRMRGGCS